MATKIQVSKPGYDQIREIDADLLPNFEASGFSVVPPKAVSNPNASISPVITASQAISDLNNKKTNFNNIVTGVESQAMANQVAKNQAQIASTQANQLSSETALKQKELDAKTASTSALGKMEELINSPASDPRSRAVLGLVENGVTGVNQLLQALNQTEDGEVIGDFTPEEIKKILSSATGTKDSKGRILSGGKYVDTPESKGSIYQQPGTQTQTTTVSQPKTFAEQMQQINQQTDEAFNQYKKDIESLRNGTFPLSATDQAQIDQVTKTFDRLREQQLIANKNYEQGITQLGISSGRSRYATGIELGNIKSAVDSGIAKIADIESKAVAAVAELRQAFEDRDYERINDQYSALTGYIEQKSKTLNEINKAAQEEAKALADKAEARQKALEFEQKEYEFVQKQSEKAAEIISSSLLQLDENNELVSPSYEEIVSVANESGVSPELLTFYVNKRGDELKKVSREERGFALDTIVKNSQLVKNQYDIDRSQTLLPYEIREKMLSQQDKLLSIEQKTKELRDSVVNTGQLSEKELVNLDRAKEKENLMLLSGLKRSISTYKDLIEKYGAAAVSPEQKRLLNSAFSEALIQWKEAARLGALTGPDMELAELAIPDVTSEGFFGSLGGLAANATGKAKRAITALDNKMDFIDKQGKENFDNLILRNEKFKDADYVRALGKPFLGEDFYIDYQDFLSTAPIEKVEDFEKKLNEAGIDDGDAEAVKEAYKLFQGNSFNQPLSMGTKGSAITKIASAIGQYESGGNYKARGPEVTSGAYKGERALGKYQIMPGNLPSWSKEALGRVVTEKEFLGNPKIQDQIAEYQMDKIYKKYGTVEDVASVWFSGKPLAKAGNAKDVIGTSVPTYVKNILANYKKMA